MTEEPQPQNEELMPAKPSRARRIFYGDQGLRVIWGVLLFLVICIAMVAVAGYGFSFVPKHLKGNIKLVPQVASECVLAVVVLFATWLMSRIERRPFLGYYLGANDKLSKFGIGAVWGFLSISVLVGLLWQCGFLSFNGFALRSLNALAYAGVWAIFFFAVGVFEETLFRGYLQYTITRGIGFWWAALISSALFLAAHISNDGESVLGLLSVITIGFIFCLGIWYTKSLWWAIGFHAAWDWGQSYFYGTPDSGFVSPGHLITTHAVGNAFWSGGADGPEGSALLFPVLVIVVLALWFWGRGQKTLASGDVNIEHRTSNAE